MTQCVPVSKPATLRSSSISCQWIPFPPSEGIILRDKINRFTMTKAQSYGRATIQDELFWNLTKLRPEVTLTFGEDF